MVQEEMPEILHSIAEADMVLVGLGREFDNARDLDKKEIYHNGKTLLENSEQSALLPMWQRVCQPSGREHVVAERLSALAQFLETKNYFVVSVSTNREIMEVPWKEGRLVMACGSDRQLQCSPSCERNLEPVPQAEVERVIVQLKQWRNMLEHEAAELLEKCTETVNLSAENIITTEIPDGFGICPVCGKLRQLCNIYCEEYDENGYLPDWQNYTKWLQGTLNKNLVVLELGVGMQFPTVIRFPFEKIAYFNQKAKFYRINENLYQITAELNQKGAGIAKNAIDWLENLC